MSELPTRIELGAESGSIILSELIRIISVFFHHLVSACCNPSTILLQKSNSAYVGQWCPHGLDGKSEEVECRQPKIDWRLTDARSSLKVVSLRTICLVYNGCTYLRTICLVYDRCVSLRTICLVFGGCVSLRTICLVFDGCISLRIICLVYGGCVSLRTMCLVYDGHVSSRTMV